MSVTLLGLVWISLNIQNEISLETFCDVVAYKFINLCKLKAKYGHKEFDDFSLFVLGLSSSFYDFTV